MTMELQQEEQPMRRLCSLETVESFVSPLRTNEDATNSSASSKPPLMDLSIMDLKARKERLQQMIRDIEIRDEQVREQQLKLQQAQQQRLMGTDATDQPSLADEAPAPLAEAAVEEESAPAETEESAPSEDAESAPSEEDDKSALAREDLAPIEEESGSVDDEDEEKEEELTTPVVDAEPQQEEELVAAAAVEEASPAATPVVAAAAADPEPPVPVESTTNSPEEQLEEQEQPEEQQLLLRPIKSAFRTGDAFAKPASPRRVFFDLSAVQVYQDFRAVPELPFKDDDFDDDNVQVEDEDNNDNDEDVDDACEDQVAEEDDDDEDSVWEEEVIEDDDVVHLAPTSPPPSTFTVSPPTWEDRERFAKKLNDMRDAEDNTSVTDDSTVSDLPSDTSFGSPTNYRFEDQQEQHQQEQHAYGSQSPTPKSRRPLSPPCARRFSMAQPLSQPLCPETVRPPKQERRMSMPSIGPKKKAHLKKTSVCSSTGKELPTPTVVSPQTLPSDSGSYPTVSLSFLAQNLTESVAVKVMQEALRILMPGGILYVFDVEGAAVKKLPDELRDLLVRVPYAGVKQTVHEIQTQEIMRNHGYVDLFPREDQIVRWMAVKASANYTVELV